MTATANTEKPSTQDGGQPPAGKAEFVFDVDDTTFGYPRPRISGAEIMKLTGINPSDGLLQLNADGTRTTIQADDIVQLVPGAQFKRRPRFKRG